MSTLPWQSALLFLFAGIVCASLLVLICDWGWRKFNDWRDERSRFVTQRPVYDSRAARHRNFSVGSDIK